MANKEKPRKSPDTFLTPGTLLRDAREKKGLKIKDVAEQLHLKQEYITALEEDDYSSFASLAYVRGYIGNYSQLLDLGDDAVASFEKLGLEAEKHTYSESSAFLFNSEKLQKRTHLVRWLSLLVFIVLVIVLAIWLQGKNKENTIPKPLDNEVQQIVTPASQPATATDTTSATTNTAKSQTAPAPAVNSTGANVPAQTTTPTPASTTTAPSVTGDATPITTTGMSN